MSTESTETPSSSSSPAPEPIPSLSSSPAPAPIDIPPANAAAASSGLVPPFPTDEHNQSNDPNMVIGGPKPIAEQIDPKSIVQAPPPVMPVASPGIPAYDRSSMRETELFESSDVVFVREGANGVLVPYPSHEAETRFAPITKRTANYRAHDGKTLTALELAGGDKVTIEGTTVIVTPADGPAEIQTPDLNAHAPLDS